MDIRKTRSSGAGLRVIDPIAHTRWDELLLGHPEASIFHTSSWARVLRESYGYAPRYFSDCEGSTLGAALPVMEVKSLITGLRGVSLPFSDYCDPIVGNEASWEDMFNRTTEYGARAGWSTIELRGTGTREGCPPFMRYYGHRLDLKPGEAGLHDSFKRSTRNNIRKALREGVAVTIGTGRGAIGEFYRLNCLTRKRHGLPPQPTDFFKNLHDHLLAKGRGFVALASYGGFPIAGAVFLHFGGALLYKYGASDMRHQHRRPNDLVFWISIVHGLKLGLRTLCFGRTELEHEGLRSFKLGFGPEERIIEYARYDIPGKRFVTGRPSNGKLRAALFKRMPVPISQCISAIFYRHAG